MKCVRTDRENDLRLQIEGSLDALTARDIRPILDEVVSVKPKLVTVDLQALTSIDSSGVGALVSLFKRVKADGGQVVVVGAHEQPLAVLRVLKLDRILGL
ncbi:Anti anti-sigma regulatory factor SypA [Labilithrix luteola]|uniref:Anti-sigma factor antagonist n=1 Tax=Labilithrix luteola TaxID=1391654 RepID=A0A0K1PYI7_9BACT|nr:STAS domain-containing protein [Labilithrix luteola]AKU98451.1 Anti anti-sigma regulatory factor SypA [Labilithrix luteola]